MFNGKPCKSNYDSTEEKVTVYSFPKEASEQERWVLSLPNKLICKISKNIGVCAKHWPVDCAKVKVRGEHEVPVGAPSLFGEMRKSCSPQTLSTKPRNAEIRYVTSEARITRAQNKADEKGNIDNFTDVVQYCGKFCPPFISSEDSKNGFRLFAMWCAT